MADCLKGVVGVLERSVIILTVDSVSIVAIVHRLIDTIIGCSIRRINWLVR